MISQGEILRLPLEKIFIIFSQKVIKSAFSVSVHALSKVLWKWGMKKI